MEEVIQRIISGSSKSEIIEYLKEAGVNDKDEIEGIINTSMKRISELGSQSASTVITTHLGWYEKIYDYFKRIDHVPGINKALRGKEKLLIKQNNTVNINSKKVTVIETGETEYDLNKLTTEEQIRLQELLDKSKA